MDFKKLIKDKLSDIKIDKEEKKEFLKGVEVQARKVRRVSYSKEIIKQASKEGKEIALKEKNKPSLAERFKSFTENVQVEQAPTNKTMKNNKPKVNEIGILQPTMEWGI